MQTLESVIVRGNNNFGLIRLFTASMVIFNHSTVLFPNNLNIIETGYLRLWVFFFLSGLFITSSFDHSKTNISFIIMRICRLWPGLVVCTFITVFVVGPILTNISVSQYFSSLITWKFWVCNSLIFNLKYYLPGVFTNNHFPNIVNNSLWTIPLELKCYTIIFGLGALGFFKKKWTMLLGFALVACYLSTTRMNFWEINPQSIILYMLFIGGGLSYFFRRYIYIDYRIAIVSLMLFVLLYVYANLPLQYLIPIAQIVLVYTVLTLGASKLFKSVKLPGDYSYGVYIYGFLVQQIIAHYLPGITPLTSLAITMPIVLLFGGLSWHLIENPALKWGKKIAKADKGDIKLWLTRTEKR